MSLSQTRSPNVLEEPRLQQGELTRFQQPVDSGAQPDRFARVCKHTITGGQYPKHQTQNVTDGIPRLDQTEWL